MRRTPFLPLILLLALSNLSPAQLTQPADSQPAKAAPATSQPAKPAAHDGELFPEIPVGTEYSKPKSKPTSPSSPPASRPATPPPVIHHPVIAATQPVTTQPVGTAPAFTPTHRITLTTGRVIDGIPTFNSPKVDIKLELGTIEIDESKIEKIEPLNPPKKSAPSQPPNN